MCGTWKAPQRMCATPHTASILEAAALACSSKHCMGGAPQYMLTTMHVLCREAFTTPR